MFMKVFQNDLKKTRCGNVRLWYYFLLSSVLALTDLLVQFHFLGYVLDCWGHETSYL